MSAIKNAAWQTESKGLNVDVRGLITLEMLLEVPSSLLK